ncbi:FadR/GntR family transcriptional regulator [Virgibacillus sp. W0430]|uniref:FadR/GntR family transcriptional regulator n=1 Tax=Virgibacillus sp. W0430 TaxID=3391580 RepID=UPI003F45C016
MSGSKWKNVDIFQNINSKKVSAYIFEQLQEAIVLKELLPGEQLPPERELCKLFNTSRITMRDAIAILKEEGFIEQKRGAKGGTFILPLTSKDIDRTREKVVKEKDKYDQLFEYRNTIEPQVVKLAIQHITESQLKELNGINKEMENEKNREEFRSLDVRFHLELAKCSRNIYFQQAVRMIRLQVNPVLDLLPFNEYVRKKSYEEHVMLLRFIEDKNADKAYELMLAHINSTSAKLNEFLENTRK